MAYGVAGATRKARLWDPKPLVEIPGALSRAKRLFTGTCKPLPLPNTHARWPHAHAAALRRRVPRKPLRAVTLQPSGSPREALRRRDALPSLPAGAVVASFSLPCLGCSWSSHVLAKRMERKDSTRAKNSRLRMVPSRPLTGSLCRFLRRCRVLRLQATLPQRLEPPAGWADRGARGSFMFPAPTRSPSALVASAPFLHALALSRPVGESCPPCACCVPLATEKHSHLPALLSTSRAAQEGKGANFAFTLWPPRDARHQSLCPPP